MFKFFRDTALASCLFKKKCPQKPPESCGDTCPQCTTLCDVEVGQCVCIRNYKGGCKKTRRRLLDLGLTPRTEVNIVQKAPLGDPILLQIGESNLSLSLSEAAHLEVDAVDSR